MVAEKPCTSTHQGAECGLTLPSSGLAPAAQPWPSFHSGPSLRCLREPLMSNVGQRELHVEPCEGHQTLQPSCTARAPVAKVVPPATSGRGSVCFAPPPRRRGRRGLSVRWRPANRCASAKKDRRPATARSFKRRMCLAKAAKASVCSSQRLGRQVTFPHATSQAQPCVRADSPRRAAFVRFGQIISAGVCRTTRTLDLHRSATCQSLRKPKRRSGVVQPIAAPYAAKNL